MYSLYLVLELHLPLVILISYILKGRLPVTLKHGKPDHEATDVRNIVQGIKLVNEFCYLHKVYLPSLG